jgi:hypothetical protein
MTVFRTLSLSCLGLLLAACTSSGSAIVDSLRVGLQSPPAVDRSTLNPDASYIRLQVDGREVYLALGFIDEHPQGPVEVWYSEGREVLRLQGGRLVGVAGLPTEWRGVVMPAELPAWRAMRTGHRWTRLRDVMPGYRMGVTDTLEVRGIPAPKGVKVVGFEGVELAWFEETALTIPDDPALRLRPSRYAVHVDEDGTETVVFAEQCVTADFCFSWQLWPTS